MKKTKTKKVKSSNKLKKAILTKAKKSSLKDYALINSAIKSGKLKFCL